MVVKWRGGARGGNIEDRRGQKPPSQREAAQIEENAISIAEADRARKARYDEFVQRNKDVERNDGWGYREDPVQTRVLKRVDAVLNHSSLSKLPMRGRAVGGK